MDKFDHFILCLTTNRKITALITLERANQIYQGLIGDFVICKIAE